jgi:hypothetical protein
MKKKTVKKYQTAGSTTEIKVSDMGKVDANKVRESQKKTGKDYTFRKVNTMSSTDSIAAKPFMKSNSGVASVKRKGGAMSSYKKGGAVKKKK